MTMVQSFGKKIKKKEEKGRKTRILGKEKSMYLSILLTPQFMSLKQFPNLCVIYPYN